MQPFGYLVPKALHKPVLRAFDNILSSMIKVEQILFQINGETMNSDPPRSPETLCRRTVPHGWCKSGTAL
jgi:hypothetical protein